MTRPLVDSRLGKSLQHFYPTQATIQTATKTVGAAGSDRQAFADDPDRTDLDCTIAPLTATELERPDQQLLRATHRVAFMEPVTVTALERVRIGSQVYDIEGVEDDSHGHATYLNVLVAE